VRDELRRRRAEIARDELVQRARVPDLVLRDRRERDILLEKRRNAGPLRVPPAGDEAVVSDLEQFLRVHAPPSASPSADTRRRGGSFAPARRRTRRSPRSPPAGRPTARPT